MFSAVVSRATTASAPPIATDSEPKPIRLKPLPARHAVGSGDVEQGDGKTCKHRFSHRASSRLRYFLVQDPLRPHEIVVVESFAERGVQLGQRALRVLRAVLLSKQIGPG